MTTQTTTSTEALAPAAAEAAEYGLSVRHWIADGRERIYLSRALARGRVQEVGYIEARRDGDEFVIDYQASRMASTVRRIAQAAGLED